MDNRPFIIISPGRSGSSYVAGNFAKAGVFGGTMREGDEWNPDGYYENIRLHRLLRENFGSDWVQGALPEEIPEWRGIVKEVMFSEGYSGGPWFFKCGAFYWKCFQSFNPVYVKVWRDRHRILESFKRTNFLIRFNDKQIEKIVDRQHRVMREIEGIDVRIEQ